MIASAIHAIQHYIDMEVIKTPKVENVRLLDRFHAYKPSIGTLYMTATHLIFVDPTGSKETWILHMHISSVEKQPLTTAGSPLHIRCKTFQSVAFVIPKERDCQEVYITLLKLSRPDLENLYAFNYSSNDAWKKSYGWDFFDTQSEYLRMGVPNQYWVRSKINSDYEICDTYPRHLYVPQSATTAVLMGSSRFRSRGRLPVLSYLHNKNKAAICRCSQPLAGFSARCVEDEVLLQAIRKANPATRYMYVVDTRPKINAMANKAQGKGYENESFYQDIKFQFFAIENIHVMRSSLQKLLDVCELKSASMNQFISGLEASGWPKHIRALLETSLFIADAVERGISVLVHCSDGWDRTAQTCSLSSIILDPYYRTIHGFQTLVEKEWLSFGHKFTDRCGFTQDVDPKETSPVFTQFIECVWQLKQQYPCSFQFNERYLLKVHDHVYSCQFGTFIGNCEKDRLDLRLSSRTYSLWAYLSKNVSDFLDPLYTKESELKYHILRPNISPHCIKFWRGMYNRFENGIHPRENVLDIVSAVKDHTASLEDHAKLLEKRVAGLCKLLGKSDEVTQRKLDGVASDESLASLQISDPTEAKVNGNGNYHTNTGNLLQIDNVTQSDTESGGVEDTASQMSKRITQLQEDMHLSSYNTCENLTVEQLTLEIDSVAQDWKSFRNVRQCSCSSPFDAQSERYHCARCGEVFCTRCIGRHIPLPGHYSQKPMPVCKDCYKRIMRKSPSSQNISSEISKVN